VATYSREPEAAIEFVRFMCSREAQVSAAVERSRLPTIAEVYDEPAVAEASEFIPRLKEVFQGGAVARPSSVTGDLYPEVSRTYWEEVNQVLVGAKSGADAVASLEESITDIMEDL
jgi:trehalose/maltose transport system substrate-binding protein